MEKKKETSFFTNLNNNINKLNKLMIIFILFIYAILLGGVYALLSTTKSYVVVPNYSHVYFNDEINPQISVIALRTFDEDGHMTLKYSVSASIYGRINESSTADPAYTINNFKMSATTVTNLKSNDGDDIYYFTEQTSYTSPTTHSYTIDNSSVNQHPSTFYTSLEYKKGSKVKVATYKEDIWLQPSNEDIENLNFYYDNNLITDASSINLIDKDDNKFGNFQVIAAKNDEASKYTGGVKITMNELTYESRHHVDMQTWIQTTTGEYLPYIGVYSYSSQKSNYVQSGRDIAYELNAEYICAKVRYYFSENNYTDYYFKQKINNLSSSFTTSPIVGSDDINGVLPTESKHVFVKVILPIIVAVVGVALVVFVSYIIIRKKNNKVDEQEENNQEDIKNE